jgi:lysophospholipase L1-like esterase
MLKANKMIEEFCSGDPARLCYFDISSFVLDENGEPDTAMFAKDGLHMSQTCYDKIAAALKPLVEKLYNSSGKGERK